MAQNQSKLPSLTQIRKLLSKLSFNPREPGLLRPILETDNPEYLKWRVIEILREQKPNLEQATRLLLILQLQLEPKPPESQINRLSSLQRQAKRKGFSEIVKTIEAAKDQLRDQPETTVHEEVIAQWEYIIKNNAKIPNGQTNNPHGVGPETGSPNTGGNS